MSIEWEEALARRSETKGQNQQHPGSASQPGDETLIEALTTVTRSLTSTRELLDQLTRSLDASVKVGSLSDVQPGGLGIKVSEDAIEDAIRAHVVRYFHDVFGTPIAEFQSKTNVRKTCSYTDARWRQLANSFNRLSWMKHLGVLLSSREMPGLSTIEELVTAIAGKVERVVSMSDFSAGFEASGKRRFARSKTREARRVRAQGPKRSGRKRTSRRIPEGPSA